jgi:Flp pilus assembly protein TadD
MASLAARSFCGEISIDGEGKRYVVGFDGGAVVSAVSPLINDSAVRLAMNYGNLTAGQVQAVSKQLADQGGDDIELVIQLARMSEDNASRFRRRVVAQKAIRTFAVERGSFMITDEHIVPWNPASAIDVRAIIFLGARTHMAERRMLQDLASMGARFHCPPSAEAELPQFAFSDAEQPIVDLLTAGYCDLGQIEEAGAGREMKSVWAVAYALAVTGVLETQDSKEVPTVRRPPALTVGFSEEPQPAVVAPSPGTPSGRVPPVTPATVAARSVSTATSPVGKGPSSGASDAGGDERAPSRGARVSAGAGPAAGASGKAPDGPGSAAHGATMAARPSVSVPARTVGEEELRPITRASTRRKIVPAGSSLGPDEIRKLIRERIALVDAEVDHFALLGVSSSSSAEEVREEYFKWARALHPDRLAAVGITDEKRDAHRLFSQINVAFSVLSDPRKRQEYAHIVSQGGAAAVRAKQAQAEELAMKILRAEEHFRGGEMALRREQFEAAIREFSQAVELNPAESEHHCLLGWATFCAASDKASVEKSARALLLKAADMAPKAPAPKLYLGRMARMLGRDDEALNFFGEAMKVSPGNVEAASEIRVLEARKQSAKDAPDKGKGGLMGRFKKT